VHLDEHKIHIFRFASEEKRNKTANYSLLVFLETEGNEISPCNRRITKVIFWFSAIKIEIFVFIPFLGKNALTGLIDSRPLIIFGETLSKILDVYLKNMLFVRVEGVDPVLVAIIEICLDLHFSINQSEILVRLESNI
jgi:hypothetical protein